MNSKYCQVLLQQAASPFPVLALCVNSRQALKHHWDVAERSIGTHVASHVYIILYTHCSVTKILLTRLISGSYLRAINIIDIIKI